MSELVKQEQGLDALNNLIMGGDMSKLSQRQKLDYYHATCNSVGLNPLTKPFDYMRLNGKEVLYANKGAAEQIRNIRGISVVSQSIEWTDDIVIVTVCGKDKEGRTDTETGFAPCKNLVGDAKGNALLKAITKAKRRLTLSMAGLGMLDETEVETIPGAQVINGETGEVLEKVKPTEIIIQDPFQIKVTMKYFKNKNETLPDWKMWGRTYCASLKNAMSEEVEEWIELNKDALENCKNDDPEVAKKVQEWIDYKTNASA